MSKNSELEKALAESRTAAVNDDPHGQKKPAKKKSVAKTPPRRQILTDDKGKGSTQERKLGVHLSTSAVQALREIEVFLMMECGVNGTNHSATISIALELAAEGMRENQSRIQELYEALKENDGRRRKSA